ncbi:MAG TPA: DUF1109 domain-containing protein [Burkholderiaceae bacterium]|nr:DUF1109 domain-containing protein [Burkholderiaceae bacterium]HQR71082.1 DUF1109 domain-containing protein [Burkholderiaceae bacterium]
MKTDDLVVALSRAAEPVDPGTASRRLVAWSGLGIVAAVPPMLLLLGLNPDLAEDSRTPMFWVKALFVVVIALFAWRLVRRLAQPGADPRAAARALPLPFVAMAVLAVIVLAAAAPGERLALILGSSWNSCPVNIAILSAPAFVLMMAAVRTLAPTRLRLAGAATGLLAGALGTLVYLLHCPELEAPFLAIWYVLGMLIPAALGALVGPRVLAW